VAWVPSRGDLLIGLFGTLSFITLIKYFEEKSWIYFTAHLAAFFVSMFSKETAILFPILFALIYYFRYYEKNVPKFFNLKNLLLISGWIIIIGFFLILRANIIKVAVKPEQFGISAFITNIWAMPEFITKFFIPIKLSGIPEFSFLISSIGILLMVGITVFSILNKKDFNYLSLIGLVWFIIFTATTMTFRHEHGKTAYDYLEHRSYLPSIGLIIFILSFIKDIKKVKLLIFCLIPLIFFYSVYSYKNIKKFENPLTFYNSVIDEGSNVALAYYNRGVNKQNSNDKQGAVEDYLKALSIKNDYAQAYNNKGNIERELKEYDIAIEDYTKAIKSKPDFAEAYSNRGVAYKEINRRDDAMTDYLKAIKINPLYPGSYNNIGVIYGTEANYPESIKYFSKAIDCDSKFGEAYKNRGLSYLFLDKRELACEDFKKGIEYGSDGGKDLYNKNCK